MINSILRMATGKEMVVTDPNEAFLLMQQNISRKREGLPLIDYVFGGELKTSMESFIIKLKARRHGQKTND